MHLTALDDDECRALLAHQAIGRVGLAIGALPVILPVNYVLVGDAIVFATDPGLKLDAARRITVACFQIDGHEPWRHSGWSVLATGRLEEIIDAQSEARCRELPLTPWAISEPVHFLQLTIELLTGRRIVRA